VKVNKARKRFFFEKKAKNFFKLGRAGFGVTGPVSRRFCAAFFKKRLLSFSYN
jgi:hypothetical protein